MELFSACRAAFPGTDCRSRHTRLPTSGCVKQAAGTLRWFSTCGRPHMFSTALMPCALAACASMYLPVQSMNNVSQPLSPFRLESALNHPQAVTISHNFSACAATAQVAFEFENTLTKHKCTGFREAGDGSPLASPMQKTLVTGLPLLSSTSIFSLTGTKPRLSTSALIAGRFRPCPQRIHFNRTLNSHNKCPSPLSRACNKPTATCPEGRKLPLHCRKTGPWLVYAKNDVFLRQKLVQ